MAPTLKIGLIREGKIPPDNRVAFTPRQCRWLLESHPSLRIAVQPSSRRCYSDREYRRAGVPLQEDLEDCDFLFGIKEVPAEQLIPGGTYLLFSHTKKKQSHNRLFMKAMVEKKITLIDYECLVHEDGQRILGFGFFAGVVGAHNGLKAYGERTGAFHLPAVYACRNFNELIHRYFGLRLPPLKVAVTGSGRVATGIIEVLNLLGVRQVEPADFRERTFPYPVYTQLKGGDLYRRTSTDFPDPVLQSFGPSATSSYDMTEFHLYPDRYTCLFPEYLPVTDILMNGIYWEEGIPPLFRKEYLRQPWFRIGVIADITCDKEGSVPVNFGSSTIADPVYGVNRNTLEKTAAYGPDTVDIMSVDNLPNELPRDASKYFGEQLIKYVMEDLLKGGSAVTERATILKNGRLTPAFAYLRHYAGPGS